MNVQHDMRSTINC